MARGIAEGQERRGCGVGALVAARRASCRVGPSIPHGRSPGPLPRIHATPAPPRGGISAPQKPTPESLFGLSLLLWQDATQLDLMTGAGGESGPMLQPHHKKAFASRSVPC